MSSDAPCARCGEIPPAFGRIFSIAPRGRVAVRPSPVESKNQDSTGERRARCPGPFGFSNAPGCVEMVPAFNEECFQAKRRVWTNRARKRALNHSQQAGIERKCHWLADNDFLKIPVRGVQEIIGFARDHGAGE